MKIVLIGNGGREATLAWKMAQSTLVSEVIVVPGNAGMAKLSSKISTASVKTRADYLDLGPNLVVVGPEAALAEGIVDFFEGRGVPVLGPTQAAAEIESSKAFCKEIMVEADIPTASYETVTSIEQGLKLIELWPTSEMVIKVDTLAAGKGVVVAGDKKEAAEALTAFFDGSYLGFKIDKIVIEDVLRGTEASAFALCDGEDFVFLGTASDYKRLNDNDQGPNTGGMGTVSPSPIITKSDEAWIKENIFSPLMSTMKRRGRPFKGFLFAGLMKTDGGFSVIEFNARLGDPETQSLLPRLSLDLVPLFEAAAMGKLRSVPFTEASADVQAVHVVMTAKGYPGIMGEPIRKGDLITIGALSSEALFFPAGVGADLRGLVTNGGRICGITCVGKGLRAVRDSAYQELRKVHFEGAHYRTDIGEKFL